MSDWHPSVIRLGKIESLPNSDYLEITTVMNEYPVILRKGEYVEGQLVSFLPYDTVCPDNDTFSFLAPPAKKDADGNVVAPAPPVGNIPLRARTIRAKQIRGTYSEGLVITAPPGLQEGDSVVEHYGLTKRVYEEELPERGSDHQESPPKGLTIPKYDLDGLAKYGYTFIEGEQVIITEKLEGENCAILYTQDKLWVRSRNWFKRDEPGSHWWEIPYRLNLFESLKNFPDLVIWGELYGGVKGWKYDCPVLAGKIQRKFRVFDIYNLKSKKFLEWKEVERITQVIGLETVPVLYQGAWTNDRSLHSLAEGKSTIGDCVREGWVMRSVPEAWHEKLGRKIVKLKGRDYKLAKG